LRRENMLDVERYGISIKKGNWREIEKDM